MSHFREYSKNIHTGRYAIKPGDNTYQLYSRLSRGYQTPVNLTIGSVRTLDRLVRSVGKQLMIDSAEIAMALYDSIFLEKMGYTEATIPAYLFPKHIRYIGMSVQQTFSPNEERDMINLEQRPTLKGPSNRDDILKKFARWPPS